MKPRHSTAFRRRLTLVPAVVAVLLTAGCQTINYYSHAALGQLRVLAGREPVPEVLARLDERRADDPGAELLYRQLAFTQEVLEFAESELALTAGDRYRTYVDLDRPAVVWNLFAAEELSLTPHRWCYPVVGCAPYRGYFSKDYAERSARRLAEQGYETYLGPVAAYSTLGWFADPLLSSFVTWPEPDLAALLFHELAHGQAWAPGDVAFNESFATFVGRQGLSVWLHEHGSDSALLERLAAQSARRRLFDLLDRTREALRRVYRSGYDDDVKRLLKAQVFAAVNQCYVDHRERLGGGRFDGLMSGLNNARLVSVATYEDMVPGFAELFAAVNGSWPEFYERVRMLAELDAGARRAALTPSPYQQVARLEGDAPSRQQEVAKRRDDGGADEIDCEALSHHLFDTEFAGRVDDHVRGGRHRQHEGA